MAKKALSRNIYVVAAKRTPFGGFGGKLKNFSAIDLGVVAARAALAEGKVDPTKVDHVVIGNVAQTSADAIYMARHVGLRSDVPIETPALTVNRLCGSGFQSVINGAQEILLGDAEIVLTGGASQLTGLGEVARRVLGRNVRLGRPLGVAGLPEAAKGPAFAAAVGLLAVVVPLLPRVHKPTPTRAWGLALAVVAIAATALGVEGLTVRGDVRWGALMGHSALGVLSGVLLLPHIRRVKARMSNAQLVLLVPITLGVWALHAQVTYVSGFEPEGLWRWETLRTPATAAERAAWTGGFPDAHLGRSASCGEAGCHAELTAQWQGSAHRFAADNRLYQAAVRQLLQERPTSEALFCANCHDPERVLGDRVDEYALPTIPPSDGVSCIACHSATGAPRPEANGVTDFRVPHVHPGDPSNIALDPRLHRQDMQATGHLMSDPGCGVCHRVQLGPDMGAHVEAVVQNPYVLPEVDADPRVGCNECHMPVRTPQEGGPMPMYDHLWSGLNVDLPAYAIGGDPAALQRVAQATATFVRTSLGIDHLPAGRTPDAAFARMQEGGGLLQVTVDAARAGETLHVTVGTTNHRAQHPFPIGPFDLQEVWQEVSLTDGQGREVVRVGAPDPDGRLPADAHRLGGIEWQRDGQPLQGHRIWDVSRISDVRQVRPGRGVTDQYRIAVPLDAPAPLTVEATWSLRRVNPEFAARAFPGEDVRFPIHRLVTASASVKSIPSGGQVQETARPQAPGSVSR